MKMKKVMALLLSMTMVAGMSVSSFADEKLTIGESEEKMIYDVLDLEEGEEYQISGETFCKEGEEITIPGNDGVEFYKQIPFTEEELQDIEEYYGKYSQDSSLYGFDNSWVQIKNTKINPYRCIAQLKITWTDGSYNFGTAAAVGDGAVLTAAHCIYNPAQPKKMKKIELFFGRNGTSYVLKAEGKKAYLPAGWKELSDVELSKDYAVIVVDKAVTNQTGTLSYSTVIPTTSDTITLTGYPYKTGSSTYNALNCYKDTGKILGYYTNKVAYKHNINCTNGDSGAPLYRDYGDDWVVCGIHSGDFNINESSGAAKTIDSKVFNLIRNAEQRGA